MSGEDKLVKDVRQTLTRLKPGPDREEYEEATGDLMTKLHDVLIKAIEGPLDDSFAVLRLKNGDVVLSHYDQKVSIGAGITDELRRRPVFRLPSRFKRLIENELNASCMPTDKGEMEVQVGGIRFEPEHRRWVAIDGRDVVLAVVEQVVSALKVVVG